MLATVIAILVTTANAIAHAHVNAYAQAPFSRCYRSCIPTAGIDGGLCS